MPSKAEIDPTTAEVLDSAKYRAVSPDLVRDLAARELAAGRSHKAAVKAVKTRLHQIAGAYAESRPDYRAWLGALAAAAEQTTTDERPKAGDQGTTSGSSLVVLGHPAFQAVCKDGRLSLIKN